MRLFWTKYRIVFTLQTRQEQGRPFRKAKDNHALYQTARERFGGWRQVLKAAGLDSHEPWSMDRVVRELQANFPHQGEHVWQDLGLAVAAERLFESCDQALRAAGFPIERPSLSSDWDKNTVRQVIHGRFHRRLSLDSDVAKEDCQLYLAARCFFGSWSHALIAAELEGQIKTWPKSMILDSLRERHQQGLPLRSTDDPELNAMCVQQFGGWRNALIAAGLKVREIRTWTQEIVIQELQTWEQRGLARMWREGYDVYRAALRCFGSWPAAIEVAGLDHKPQIRWTQGRIFRELRQWRTNSGQKHTRIDVCLQSACRDRFGSVAEALKAAGLEPLPRGEWTPDRVITEIQDRHVQGLQIEKPYQANRSLAQAAYRYFGSWRGALAACGLESRFKPPSPRRDWTPDKLVQEIQSRDRSGMSMAYSKHLDLKTPAVKFYGGWLAAKVAAGLKPIYKSWSREKVIAEIQKSVNPPLSRKELEALQAVARRYFENWATALTAAGLSQEKQSHVA